MSGICKDHAAKLVDDTLVEIVGRGQEKHSMEESSRTINARKMSILNESIFFSL